MTVQQVLDAFPVTKAALYQRFGIPADTPTATTLSTLKEAGDLSGFDIPTLRTWLAEQAAGSAQPPSSAKGSHPRVPAAGHLLHGGRGLEGADQLRARPDGPGRTAEH